MNSIKQRLNPLLNRSKRESKTQCRQFCNVHICIGCLILFASLISPTFGAETVETDENAPAASSAEAETVRTDTVENAGTLVEVSKEVITGTSTRMERYEKLGITILIGEAKTVRHDEQGVEIGFLNADKITLKSDIETGETLEIVAEGYVEIRDQDIFATCDHATMDNSTHTITLKDNVVVLQNKDRLETKHFTFNRVTGKQTGEGGVKFKVSVTQATPVSTETGESSENGAEISEEKTAGAAPEKTGTKAEAEKKETDADADAEKKSDADESGSQNPPTEADESESGSQNSPTEADDTETETPDDADADAETDESENN